MIDFSRSFIFQAVGYSFPGLIGLYSLSAFSASEATAMRPVAIPRAASLRSPVCTSVKRRAFSALASKGDVNLH